MLKVRRFIETYEDGGHTYHCAICLDENNNEVKKVYSDSERAMIEHIQENLKPKMTYDQLRDLVNLINNLGEEKYKLGYSDGFHSH